MRYAFILIFFICSLFASTEIVSGSKTGYYYAVAKDIQDISYSGLDDIQVISTNGSLENLLRIIKDDDIDFAMIQYDAFSFFLSSDLYTEEEKNKVRNLRVVLPLYNEVIHVITKKSLHIKNIADFKNLRVSVGKNNSGSYVSARIITSHTDMRWKKTYKYNSLLESLQAILDNKLDAVFYVGGFPVKDLTIAKENPNYKIFKDNFEIFNFSDQQNIKEIYPFISVSKDEYQWIEHTLMAPSVKAIIVAKNSKKNSKEYLKVKKLYENLYKNINILKNGKYNKKWKDIDLRDFTDIKIKIHPAVKEYLESLTNKKIKQKDSKDTIKQDSNYIYYILIFLVLLVAIGVFFKFKKFSKTKKNNEGSSKTVFLSKVTLLSLDIHFPSIEFNLKDTVSIGRSSACDIIINKEFISSRHLKLILKGDKIEVIDLGSTNGTYIDGEKLEPNKTYTLAKDQVLVIGSEEVSYQIKGSNNKSSSKIKKQEVILSSLNQVYNDITKEGVLGRSDECDIVIKNENISRKHLMIRKEIRTTLHPSSPDISITDLGSANGTYIDGKKLPVNESVIIEKGQTLVIGSEDVAYRVL
jgi:TRAP transporter TAXI family solute receptor